MSGHQQKIGSGIVLTGGCSMLQNIDSLAEKVFNVPVRIGKPRGVTGLIDVLQSPIYATGTGLVHYGFLAKSDGGEKKVIRKTRLLHGMLSRMKNLYKGGSE